MEKQIVNIKIAEKEGEDNKIEITYSVEEPNIEITETVDLDNVPQGFFGF